ncbi:MAG: NAD kinase [bacterium]
MVKIGVYGKSFSPGFDSDITLLFNILKEKNAEVIVFKPFLDYIRTEKHINPGFEKTFSNYNMVEPNMDFMFSIGGDGTFLETVSHVRGKNIPIIGLNTGRLGFLSNVAKEEIIPSINALFEKKYTLEKRTLLTVDSGGMLFKEYNCALNEISVQKKGSAMITVHAYANNEFINSYWTDGLIISTPTGSTAYALSVGGPIIEPGSKSITILPIAPHNLNVRPLILNDNLEIKLKVEGRVNSFLVTSDYRSEEFDGSRELIIKTAPFTVKTIKLLGNTFYNTLRNKLMWGADKRN